MKISPAGKDGFDSLLTGDQTLACEQNLTGRRVAIVVLSSLDWHILKNHLPPIVAALDNALPGSLQEVECGGI